MKRKVKQLGESLGREIKS